MKALLNWFENRRKRVIQRKAQRRLDCITRARREALEALEMGQAQPSFQAGLEHAEGRGMRRAPGSYAGLTVMQANLLSFLRAEQAADRSPSYEEMRAAVGLKSRSGINRLVLALEERGYVTRYPFRARSIVANAEGRKPAPPTPTLETASIPQLLEAIRQRGVAVALVGELR